MRRSALALSLALLVLQGCATVAVERGKDVSSAAIRYADTTTAVIDVAINAAIDADSEAQVRSAPRAAVPPQAQPVRAQRLEMLDADLAKTVSLYTTLKHSVRSTKAYFVALQDLANGSQAEATGDAVQAVAQRVNSVNTALQGAAATPKFSAAQITALGGLASQVAAQVHGAKVAQALQRDAEKIGRALMLQQAVLQLAADDIRNNLTEANNRFYVDRVRTPYQQGALNAGWVDDRRTYLKVRALGQTESALTAAQSAAGQMQTVWQRILAGTFTASEINAVPKDTEDLLDAVSALKAADKPK